MFGFEEDVLYWLFENEQVKWIEKYLNHPRTDRNDVNKIYDNDYADSETLLISATALGNMELIKLLVEKYKFDCNTLLTHRSTLPGESTVFSNCCESENGECLKYFIETILEKYYDKKFDFTETACYGRNGIEIALRARELDNALYLIDYFEKNKIKVEIRAVNEYDVKKNRKNEYGSDVNTEGVRTIIHQLCRYSHQYNEEKYTNMYQNYKKFSSI